MDVRTNFFQVVPQGLVFYAKISDIENVVNASKQLDILILAIIRDLERLPFFTWV